MLESSVTSSKKTAARMILSVQTTATLNSPLASIRILKRDLTSA